MNSNDLQDHEEELIFSEFRSVFPIPGEILPKEKDQKPDVIIDQGNKKLGIEITELSDIDQPIYGSQRLLAIELENVLDLLLPYKIEVHLFFSHTIKIRQKERRKCAKTIGNEIAAHITKFSRTNRELQTSCIEDNDYGIGISSIELVSFFDNGKSIYERNIVLISHSGWISTAFPDELQQRIAAKNLKFNKYMENVDECWLLVYSHTFMPEGQYSFGTEMIEKEYISSFGKTIFYEHKNRKYHELKTKFA